MLFDVSTYTDIGGRECNEDTVSARCEGPYVFALVADGLGGHQSGEIASTLAVETIAGKLGSSAATVDEAVAGFEEANQVIRLEQKKQSSSMRTTAAALWLSSEGIGFALNAGDTRIYQFRGSEVIFQSKDHSVAQHEVDMGDISLEEVRRCPSRNMLVKCLGAFDRARPQHYELQAFPGDSFLVCTDGIWENILESRMIQLLSKSGSSKEWLRLIRESVKQETGGSGDNNTAAAIICGLE